MKPTTSKPDENNSLECAAGHGKEWQKPTLEILGSNHTANFGADSGDSADTFS
jgi:hypothetical protein